MPIKEDTFPDVVRIESAGLCNFRCMHCPTGIDSNSRRALTLEMFAAIVKQFEKEHFIPRVVVLYHGGEPLLNKHLPEFIAILKKIGVSKTVITTNGSLLNKKLAEKLILAGLDELKVTFDGQSAEENNKIRKNGDFFRDADNIKEMCKIRKALNRANPAISVGNVRFCDKKTLALLNKNSLDFLNDMPAYITEFFKEEKEQIRFFSYPAMQWPGYNSNSNFEVLHFPTRDIDYCESLFETISILSNGNIVPCCYDLKGEAVFGNVFKTGIFTIWKSKEYKEFRINFRNRKYPSFCLKCNILSPRYLLRKTL